MWNYHKLLFINSLKDVITNNNWNMFNFLAQFCIICKNIFLNVKRCVFYYFINQFEVKQSKEWVKYDISHSHTLA